MVTTDIILMLLVVLWAAFGLATGAIKQIAHAASLVIAIILARPAGKIVGDFLIRKYDQPPSIAAVLGTVLAGAVIFAMAKLLFWIVNSYLGREGGKMSWSSRLFGAGLGAVKATLVIWLVASIIAEDSLMRSKILKDINVRLSKSKIASWMVNTYNPVEHLRVGTTLDKLERVSENPQAMRNMADDEKVASFLKKLRGKVLERITDEDLKSRVQKNDPAAIIEAAHIGDFLADEELLEALLEIDAGSALDTALEDLSEPETDE